ncbi:MAG: SUMF1/EgtB/PvdO family nonheme iron enzyme [Termitinemataceae bacterium]|nr:MAG: SUMF1/EgtB/PvdO family nonheme iron enzyme [Termitinemataceae bacterium]
MIEKKSAAKKQQTQAETEIADALPIHLKPLFGIKPGKYLAALYLTVIILAVFFTLFFPGIVRSGSKYTFNSYPQGAAIRVDDVYMAQCPAKIFIPAGARTIQFVMPAFENKQIELNVKRNILSHSPFAKVNNIEVSLLEIDPLAALVNGAKEFAAWSFTDEPNNTYQIPLSLSVGALRSALNKIDTKEADKILYAAARFTTTRTALKDLMRAKYFIDNGSAALSPFNIVSTAQNIINYMAENPAFTVKVCDLLGENARFIFESAWYKKNVIDAIYPDGGRYNESNNLSTRQYARFGSKVNVAGVDFIEAASGIFEAAPDFKFSMPISNFYIALNEVSDAQYAAFLNENPKWQKDNIDLLTEEGFVNSDYLVEYAESSFPHPTASGVSWFAAQEFCKWLTKKLPASFSGWEIRLPNEIEWEYAAKGVESGSANSAAIKNMFNTNIPSNTLVSNAGSWEWCADLFAPLYFLPATSTAIEQVSSPQRSLRGGSWVNAAGSVSLETRAGLHPDSCSPFVSFRPVIAKKITTEIF